MKTFFDCLLEELLRDPSPTRVRIGYGKYRNTPEWPDHPSGCPDGILLISGETAEARAFRRFPIDAHKPRWD